VHRTVSDVIVEALVGQDVRRVFGVVGDALNSFTDAIRRTDGIDWIRVRHDGLDQQFPVRSQHTSELFERPLVVVASKYPNDVNQHTTASNGPETGSSRRSPSR
jgi:Thiamine pyrophosphate enzyme, N-terminal TPP binding domain